MAVVTTKAIVLSALKYGDTSLIVKCFTAQEGLKTYLIRGVLSSKKGNLKAGYFQVLNQLNIVGNHNSKGNLNSLKEAHILNPYKTIYSDIVKQSIVLFLAEVLSNCIQEEEKNESLYNFLEGGLLWLDTEEKIVNFHLLFLLNLTQYLGFYPNISDEKIGFDLVEGEFSFSTSSKNIIYGEDLNQFKKLLNRNFQDLENIFFSKNQRQQALQIILKYYKLHLDGFRNPKSLAILETVFS